MNKWQTLTNVDVTEGKLRLITDSLIESISLLQEFSSEFLVHAADVEGLCKGIDQDLVRSLGEWSSIPCTYAGGASSIADLDLVSRLSKDTVDLTFGSALDIFGGQGVALKECIDWNNDHDNVASSK